jgi:hypothetical protein
MAIGTPVNLGQANASTSVVITTGASVSAGDTIVVSIAVQNSATISSVVDSAGNNYASDKSASQGSEQGYIYRCANVLALASSGTITVSSNASNATAAAISISGITNALDASGTGTGNSSTPSASATNVTADAIFVGAVAFNTGAVLTQPGGSWNALTGKTGTGGADLAWAYQIVAATGSKTYNPTLDVGTQWTDVLVVYAATTSDTLFAQAAM